MASVAVIGGGLGGLTAALLCAKAGCNVSLFEKEPVCGGYSIAYKRSGFTFDAALHALPAGDNGSWFFTLLQRLGIDSQIQLIKIKSGIKVTFGRNSYCLPSGRSEVLEYLQQQFPDDASGLIRLFNDIDRYARCYSRILLAPEVSCWPVLSFIPYSLQFLSQSYETTAHFLSKYVKTTECRALLYQYAIFMGIPMDEFPAVNFIMMVHIQLTLGMYTIEGGGAHLTAILTKECERNNVTIYCSRRIDTIEITNGIASAVVDNNGVRHATDYVVSNVNTIDLCKMVPANYIPHKYLSIVSRLKPSVAVVLINIGLDIHIEDAGFKEHLHFHFPDSDLDQCVKVQREALTIRGFSITAAGLTSPDVASKNMYSISIVGAVNGKQWFLLDNSQYAQAKEILIEQTLEKLYTLYPLLKGHVVCVDCATPKTFKRYTGNPDGAIMGFNCTTGVHRDLIEISKFPVKNILIANAWTDKLGGYMQCISAGEKAAKVIKRKCHTD
jgi:phytoene dehydrogenase-like protein